MGETTFQDPESVESDSSSQTIIETFFFFKGILGLLDNEASCCFSVN